jgi:hypothetical protein
MYTVEFEDDHAVASVFATGCRSALERLHYGARIEAAMKGPDKNPARIWSIFEDKRSGAAWKNLVVYRGVIGMPRAHDLAGSPDEPIKAILVMSGYPRLGIM